MPRTPTVAPTRRKTPATWNKGSCGLGGMSQEGSNFRTAGVQRAAWRKPGAKLFPSRITPIANTATPQMIKASRSRGER